MHTNSDGVIVETENIRAFSYRPERQPKGVAGVPFLVDGQAVELDKTTWELPNSSFSLVEEDGVWTVSVWVRVRAVTLDCSTT